MSRSAGTAACSASQAIRTALLGLLTALVALLAAVCVSPGSTAPRRCRGATS